MTKKNFMGFLYSILDEEKFDFESPELSKLVFEKINVDESEGISYD